MAKNLSGKRPCSICRKWFRPDVRQKGRQKTCGPDCQRELHRRQCEAWNQKNKADHKNNYLDKKLEKAGEQKTQSSAVLLQRRTPVLPMEVIVKEYGIKSAVIVQYLVRQIINQTNVKIRGFP